MDYAISEVLYAMVSPQPVCVWGDKKRLSGGSTDMQLTPTTAMPASAADSAISRQGDVPAPQGHITRAKTAFSLGHLVSLHP